MTKTNESKRDKFILLVIMLLSFLFVLGCGIRGNEPKQEPIRYDMCPGVFTKSSNDSYNMIYYGTNQEKASGLLKDEKGNDVADSSFRYPMYTTDDRTWIADGYVYDSKNTLKPGDYTFEFSVNSEEYKVTKNIIWENIPEWKSHQLFTYDPEHRIISINNPGIVHNDYSKKFEVTYSIKIYNAVGESYSTYSYTQLVGQTKRNDKTAKQACTIGYQLPEKIFLRELNKFYPVLVADFCDNSGMKMIMYYCPGQVFNY